MSHCFLRWAWDMHTMILSKGVQYTMPAEKVEVRRLPQQILCTFSYHRHVYVERSKLELKNLGEHPGLMQQLGCNLLWASQDFPHLERVCLHVNC